MTSFLRISAQELESTPRQLLTVHIVYIYRVSIYFKLQHHTMTENYPIGTRAESERLVRDWGFRHVFTWSDGRYGPS